MLPKKLAERKHAKRRFSERYGETINRKQYKEFISYIQGTVPDHVSVEFLKKSSNRTSLFRIIKSDVEYIVVYDRERKEIVTFLLPEYLEGKDG